LDSRDWYRGGTGGAFAKGVASFSAASGGECRPHGDYADAEAVAQAVANLNGTTIQRKRQGLSFALERESDWD
jgi:hypothetical protein